MNTKYDKIADALYVKFKQGKIAKTLRLENHAKSQLAPSFVKQFLIKSGIKQPIFA